MTQRIQSPSSINTYKQCPRKYYYIYIEKRPTKPSIHLVRGSVVHETLEDFFRRQIQHLTGEVKTDLILHALTICKEKWIKYEKEMSEIGLTATEIISYKEETSLMLINWIEHLWSELQAEIAEGRTFEEAFLRHTPRMEEQYIDHELKVRGFIDAIHERDGKVHIRDYKTSKNPIISEEYKLQLAIYAMLYNNKHGVLPDSVGIFFLKHGERLMELNDEILRATDIDIKWVHERTESDAMHDYPKKPSALCNYCDFYDLCFKQREITDY